MTKEEAIKIIEHLGIKDLENNYSQYFNSPEEAQRKISAALELALECLKSQAAENKIIKHCGNCIYTDGNCYTSYPPQVKCTKSGKFHFGTDECDIDNNKTIPAGSSNINDYEPGYKFDIDRTTTPYTIETTGTTYKYETNPGTAIYTIPPTEEKDYSKTFTVKRGNSELKINAQAEKDFYDKYNHSEKL